MIEDLRRKEQQEPAETNRHERVSSPLLDHTHHVRIVGCPIKDPPVKFIILYQVGTTDSRPQLIKVENNIYFTCNSFRVTRVSLFESRFVHFVLFVCET